jgi:hypothetical protein
MCDAIHAAEAEAQRKVEESYQEASCAGEQYNKTTCICRQFAAWLYEKGVIAGHWRLQACW